MNLGSPLEAVHTEEPQHQLPSLLLRFGITAREFPLTLRLAQRLARGIVLGMIPW